MAWVWWYLAIGFVLAPAATIYAFRGGSEGWDWFARFVVGGFFVGVVTLWLPLALFGAATELSIWKMELDTRLSLDEAAMDRRMEEQRRSRSSQE